MYLAEFNGDCFIPGRCLFTIATSHWTGLTGDFLSFYFGISGLRALHRACRAWKDDLDPGARECRKTIEQGPNRSPCCRGSRISEGPVVYNNPTDRHTAEELLFRINWFKH